MSSRLRRAFEGIRADERLRADTLAALQGKVRGPRQGRLVAAAIAACLIVVMGVAGYGAYFTEAAFVDVDINPSVALAVNRFDRVIAQSAYNDEGEALLAQLRLTHQPYGDAVELLTEAAIGEGFLAEGGLVSVTVQTDDRARESAYLEALTQDVGAAVLHHSASAQVDVFSVDADTRTCARDLSLTPAKYLAILDLQEVDPTATMEGCRGHSVGAIRSMAENRGGGGGMGMGHHGRGH